MAMTPSRNAAKAVSQQPHFGGVHYRPCARARSAARARTDARARPRVRNPMDVPFAHAPASESATASASAQLQGRLRPRGVFVHEASTSTGRPRLLHVRVCSASVPAPRLLRMSAWRLRLLGVRVSSVFASARMRPRAASYCAFARIRKMGPSNRRAHAGAL